MAPLHCNTTTDLHGVPSGLNSKCDRFDNRSYAGDIDSLATSGIYTYDQQSVTTGTFPATNRYGAIFVMGGTSANYALQICKPNAQNNNLYIRYKIVGTWTDWLRFTLVQ